MSSLSVRPDSYTATQHTTNVVDTGSAEREASTRNPPTPDARFVVLSERPRAPAPSGSRVRVPLPPTIGDVKPRRALDEAALIQLTARYVPRTGREPRGLGACVRMLQRVALHANPAIAKLQNDLFLLTTVVGSKQSPFRFDRADYMKCCGDVGEELTHVLGLRANEFFGNTPLINALFNDNEDLSVALILHHLSCGVSLNEGDAQGKTPLMISAIKGHRDAFELLLGHGANPNLHDQAGNNVLHLICMRGDIKTFDALRRSMPSSGFLELANHPNAEGRRPADLLNPALEHELFEEVSTDEKNMERYGRFDRDYSIWVGRPATATCDMDTNIGRNSDPRTLREILVADRRQLAEMMAGSSAKALAV